MIGNTNAVVKKGGGGEVVVQVQGYVKEQVRNEDTVKLNPGVGDGPADYDVYGGFTTQTNELTFLGITLNNGIVGDIVNVNTVLPNAQISVVANEDNAIIDFNNSNEIDQVNFNVVAKDIYLAFTQSDKTIYFKNTTLPFIPSENTFESKSYTYYTYENDIMVEHTAATSSSTTDVNIYDGTTLVIDTTDTFSNGTWTRDNTQDIEIDNGDAVITTSGYLTTQQAIIPTNTYFKFACAKLNPNQWDTKLIIGGQEQKFIHMQEFIVQANQLIELYCTKHGSNYLIDTYNQYFYISNDKLFKKINYIISITNEGITNANINFTINGVKFNYAGNTANIDLYEGQTVNWEVSADGYTTQTGTYTVASYPTINSYTNSITLVQA